MDYSDKAVELVSSSEGCVLHAYPDAGGYSIGWGTHADWVKPGMTCTQEQADSWRNAKMTEIAIEITELVKTAINQNQFDALVDFCYNLGTGALQVSTLLHKLNIGDLQGAAAEFPKWDFVQHKPNKNLLARRLREQELFLA